MAHVTYSFVDIVATIKGPSGTINVASSGSANLGNEAGVAEEGISIEPQEDKDTMVWGADGALMHSLHAAVPFRVTVRLLKTSPMNAKLSIMFNNQMLTSRDWGGNTITVKNNISLDSFTGTDMAFMRFPTVSYAKEGPMNEWAFGGRGVWVLGDYLVQGA
jgi:hypothetical protein